MDKTAIKNFAIWARVKLMTDISTRLGFLGITENSIAEPLTASTDEIKYFDIGASAPVSVKGVAIRQRNEIVQKIRQDAAEENLAKAYHNFVETMAFDWFNRLVAIRYMEINEYAPLDIRLLSSVEPGRQDPDLVTSPFDGSLEYTENDEKKIQDLKSTHDNAKLFRFLLFKMCNQLHDILPGIFEGDNDYSELLMRQSFIDKDGVIYHLVHDIPEEDWKDQVQIIGWIYQYYNTELKDETFKLLKKNVKISKERIPSATQLFTPDWIVRYMVENSLGRLWINHLKALDGDVDEKQTAEKFGWQYYIPEAKQEPEVEAKLVEIRKDYENLRPEDLTCLDPCMGSGHILSYFFDVLMQIYTSVGYSERDAAKSILEHNIYGLDIDDRAYQLAYFSVMMKARQYNRRILSAGIRPHVYAIEESNGIRKEDLQTLGEHMPESERAIALQQAEKLVDLFHDAKIYGSILQIPEMDWDLLRKFVSTEDENGQSNLNWNVETQSQLTTLIDLGETLSKKYWITVTNPPYMGGSGMDDKLSKFVKEHYPDGKADLFSVFIEVCGNVIQKAGFYGMITQHAWMFLSSFEQLRMKLMANTTINMLHLGARSFDEINGEIVQTTAFVKTGQIINNFSGSYIRLIDFNGERTQSLKTKNAISNQNCKYFYEANDEQYCLIPGKPVAYWVSKNTISLFEKCKKVDAYSKPLAGICTGDNNSFLRIWYEVNSLQIGTEITAREEALIQREFHWYFLYKGGEFRRWYGNYDYIINYSNNSLKLMERNKGFRHDSRNYYFKPGITWTKMCSGNFSARIMREGCIFDSTGTSMFPDKENKLYLLGLLNSKVTQYIVQILNPTFAIYPNNIANIPVEKDLSQVETIEYLVKQNIFISKNDWNSFETSWDFKGAPLTRYKKTNISEAYEIWADEKDSRYKSLKKNEEELNRIFIEIYHLQNELSPSVEDSAISIRLTDQKQDIKDLLSYAIGCMLGRYSLDEEGLVYAGGIWDPSRYHKFLPDADNVIPITDQKYLDDDVVERICEFVTTVYGKETLEENLDFIAKALGGKGVTSRDIIRTYMLTEFFKDHCNTYSVTGSGKRPIYWLFDSGKQNAFKALVYMHRWDADTTGRVLIYAQKIQQKYETELRAIDTMLDHLTDPKEQAREERRQEHLRKQLAELVDYEERLEHMANERITIDLDDGVKVNYEKVQTDRNGKKFQILAPIK